MVQRIYRDALLSISQHEDKVSIESTHLIDESYRMTVFLRELLSQMKEHVLSNGFATKHEEIEFFRKIKPQILGKLIYYNKLYRIEASCPFSSGKMHQKYYSGELQSLKQEYQDQICNSDFFRYYRSGRTDLDHEYFELGKINFNDGLNSYVFEIDPHFSTYYDYKVSRIIANELLYSYLLSKVTPGDVEAKVSDKDFYWTDSKNALIELIYALCASESISGGKIGIRKMSIVFQIVFRIPLGDIHHAFHRMKDRVGSRTAFIDHLKTSLEEYMDKDL
ncbi:RteC domain-containing protein [Chryseobacterium viscerum]|uniref:Tetracycline regulation of excision, RteC n=1 Tax=Chryseobacterium viscerum TaxID=1037377 RepID=A0A316WSK4_9FLAO|nr:RteC domain-containing protein [Chryseobacterium viscerum]PWN64197.1 tetracycline regulation of excision, RteC [Chryseobacterium viscerum]